MNARDIQGLRDTTVQLQSLLTDAVYAATQGNDAQAAILLSDARHMATRIVASLPVDDPDGSV